MDSRGTVKVESLVLWVAVALGGLLGVRTVGAGTAAAIGSDSVVARVAPMTVSRAAATSDLIHAAVTQALHAAEFDGVTDARAVAHVAISSDEVAAELGIRYFDWSQRTIRMGVPEYVHEGEQALRYGDIRGGGVYVFSPKTLGAEGIDGIFARWDSEGPVDLTRFDSTRTSVGWEWRGVSLKDFSGKEGTPEKILAKALGDLRENRKHVIRAGYGTAAEPPFPSYGGADAHVLLPQLTVSDILRESRRGEIRRRRSLHALVPAPGGERVAFQRIFFEAEDGVVRVRRLRSGTLVVEDISGAAPPRTAPVH